MKKLAIYLLIASSLYITPFCNAEVIRGYPGYYDLDLDRINKAKKELGKIEQYLQVDQTLRTTVTDFQNILDSNFEDEYETNVPVISKENIKEKLIKAKKTKLKEIVRKFNSNANDKEIKLDFQNKDCINELKEYHQKYKDIELLTEAYCKRTENNKYNQHSYNAAKRMINNLFFNTPVHYQQYRDKIYDIFVKSGFLIPLTTPTTEYDIKIAIKAFIKDNGHIDTLILGNGYSLDAETSDLVGVRQVSKPGYEKITLEDLEANALWIDFEFTHEPDIIGDLHDPSLYETIEKIQGKNSLKTISERAWEYAEISDNILLLIKELLKTGGTLEFLEEVLIKSEDKPSDIGMRLIKRIENKGFKLFKVDKNRSALIFIKQ